MVQIKEFRITMPVSLEEYQVAQMYMVMKMQQDNTNGAEGVEALENRIMNFDNLGECQYTNKIYRFKSKAPSWVTALAPADALVMQEEAWNAYPKCKALIKCPYFTKFSLRVDTVHVTDSGESQNVHGLTEEQLAIRQIEFLDIASSPTDYWSFIVGRNKTDFSKFKSARTGRGELLKGWQDRCKPIMTAYKLVIVDAPYWGFGQKLEKALLAGERALFLESHRNCFQWIDEWFGKTVEEMLELELQSDSTLNKKLGKQTSKTLKSSKDFDKTFPVDNEDVNSKKFPVESKKLAVDN